MLIATIIFNILSFTLKLHIPIIHALEREREKNKLMVL